jgi:hypothetical protein
VLETNHAEDESRVASGGFQTCHSLFFPSEIFFTPMGKQHGKPRQTHRHHHDFSEATNKFSSSGLVKKSAPSNPSKKGKQPQHVKAVVPFRPSDHILLVGEGQSFDEELIDLNGASP